MADDTVLVVDDEPDIQALVKITLEKMSLQSEVASSVAEAKAKLKSHEFVLCLADMRLPDGDGIDLVSWIQKNYPQVPVAVITAFGNVEGAVNTLKAGAFDYVSKPVDLGMLRDLVNAALRLSDVSVAQNTDALEFLGSSKPMEDLKACIEKISRSQAPVLIQGPSGVGKELVARLIHQRSPRRDGAFIPVNCGAIPADLMESEFFGHVKGSFTGAHTDKVGLFQAAHHGTLFLDEIADLSLNMQVKLLRAIQEKAIKPIGATHEMPVNMRILSATHKNLAELVAKGQFRQDLYYRINVIDVTVPPLQQRRGDIPQIARYLVDKIAHDQSREQLSISQASLDRLSTYSFPGNIRELENIIERASTLCEHECIELDDLNLPHDAFDFQDSSAIDLNDVTLDDYLLEQEKALILKTLEDHKWNKTQAARALGLTFRSLRYRLQKLDLGSR